MLGDVNIDKKTYAKQGGYKVNREFLKGLGLETEVIDKVMAEHGKTIELHKGKNENLDTEVTKLKGDIAKLKGDITSKDTEISELKKDKGDYDDLKGKFDTLKSEYDTFKNDITSKQTAEQKETLVKEKLVKEGFNEKIVNLLAKEILSKDITIENNEVQGWEEMVSPLKESYSDFVTQTVIEGAEPSNPLDGQANNTDDAFLKGFDSI